MKTETYWETVVQRYSKSTFGNIAAAFVLLFILMAIYAPFLASSKPLAVKYDGQWYFPLFRYLFYTGFFTKHLDIFFNLLIFTLPLALFCYALLRHKRPLLIGSIACVCAVQMISFLYLTFYPIHDPEFDEHLLKVRQEYIKTHPTPDWNEDLNTMNPYAKLNLVLRYQQRQKQYEQLKKIAGNTRSSLWELDRNNQAEEVARLKKVLESSPKESAAHTKAKASLSYIVEREQWLSEQTSHLSHIFMPLIRPFHWEDDAGGDQALNKVVPFWELSRINRKDLVAALIFGTRISLVVGILSVSLALLIGLPLGACAGYYGGNFDIIVCRLMEIWEAMPTLFMLLTVVSILQNKSIFLIIAVIGLFGWISFSRYMRGEFFKQRNLSYIEACRATGLPNRTIIFSHILPNAIPPLLTLLPFDIMAAITSEAGLSFLGLGEEGSCSWGVLMDEGRTAFPYESYLLWPPAILLTILLVSIAIIGDNFRDAIDPKTE